MIYVKTLMSNDCRSTAQSVTINLLKNMPKKFKMIHLVLHYGIIILAL
jgi:hypothetical protein